MRVMECERVGMWNVEGTFETRKGSFGTAFSICMTAFKNKTFKKLIIYKSRSRKT